MSTETQPIIDAAIAAAAPEPLDDATRFYAITTPAGGSTQVIDLEAKREHLRDTPRRKTGTYVVHDADSFVAYLAKHGDKQSEVWADAVAAKITGVLNAHTSGGARFEDHRVIYAVILTEAWKRWTKHDSQFLDQEDFADLIEERAIDVVSPSGAEMLEIAQTFKATTNVRMESSVRLSTGQRQFTYHEEVDGKAGKAGRMEIPEVFSLGLKPFEGADAFKINARLRYRIHDGNLRIGYKLERPEDVLREAFGSVVHKVRTQVAELDLIHAPILLGAR